MPSETIQLRGHIIDSLILPKVLDEIISHGATFKIGEVNIGEQRKDQSFARIEVMAPDANTLDALVLRLRQHGAEVEEKKNVQLATAPADGVFPQDFYITTNQRTFARIDDTEIEVHPTLMDSAIVVDRASKTATAKRFREVKKGMETVVGHQGIRVEPLQRLASHSDLFEFLSSPASVEKPKSVVIREMAQEIKRAKGGNGRILVVGGPAIVHTGAGEHFEKLIAGGFVQRLFAGNALAAHDLENALFGTSLGVNLEEGGLARQGTQNYLRAINAVCGAGGIRPAVASGLVKRGIFYQCVKHGVDFVLAGSIRDDGPLPDVITDVLEAQKAMRAKLDGVTMAVMMGTMLHSIAVANLLPATVKMLCIDINPAVVAKLTERGNFQTVGLVTDMEPFLRELTSCVVGDR
jgi:lysine-ketoglutarate reductase/saccharopine dehydrogenase-like protein (TIGR00300 family)